jgi:hypothetical protein
LGIGGWQTIAASDVDRRKYGDCKALSNYMLSMLAAVGIEGRYVIIKAGDESDDKIQYPDFPNPFFNHAIACVPMQKDTVWLECTSQTQPCGFLGSFTQDRMALLVSPQGGTITHTPIYNEQVNTIKRKVEIALNTEGGGTVKSLTTYAGLKQELARQISEANTDIKKKVMYELLKINNFEIKEMNYKSNRERIPTVAESLVLNVNNIASLSGKRMFIPINLFSKWENVPSPDSTRIYDVQADENGFTELDSITLILPEGYTLESKSNPLSISSPFGQYDIKTNIEGNRLHYYRRLTLNNKIYTKTKYNELVDFFKNIAKTDKSKIVLVKNTQ